MTAEEIKAENARVLHDFEGYLRTCRCGGMPVEASDAMLNGVKHFLEMRAANAEIADIANNPDIAGLKLTEQICFEKVKKERDARAQLFDELGDAAEILRSNDAPYCAELVERARSLLSQPTEGNRRYDL